MTCASRRRKREQGAALVEAAISLTLLFTLILAIIEFARAFNVYQTLELAAREGARFAVAPAPGTTTLPTSDEVKAYTQSFLDLSNVTGTTISVNQTLNGAAIGGAPTVYSDITISVPYNSFLLGGGGLTITAESRMRNETN